MITLPVIHLNGTSAQELLDNYTEAYRKVNEAVDALMKCHPNGRDYYVKPGTLVAAIHENNLRILALNNIAEQLMDLAQHCNQYVK